MHPFFKYPNECEKQRGALFSATKNYCRSHLSGAKTEDDVRACADETFKPVMVRCLRDGPEKAAELYNLDTFKMR